MHVRKFLHENEHVLLDEGVRENERACLQAQPAASKFVEYVGGREETANVRYACIPSATTTTTKYTVESCLAADSCFPNAVVFRRSLRLRERERMRASKCARERKRARRVRQVLK